MSADSENPSALQQKAINASSMASDFSFTSVKCNAKTSDGSSDPSVKFVVTPQSRAETSATSFVFAVHTNGVSELSVSFDLHCNLSASTRSTDEKNGKRTEIGKVSRVEESTVVQPITEESKAADFSDALELKKDDSLPSTEKETTDASGTFPTSSVSTPSNVSTITSATRSKSETREEFCTEKSSTETIEFNSPAAVPRDPIPEAPAFGWLSNDPHTRENVSVGFGQSVTGKGFDREPDTRACFACRFSAPPPGSSLSWRPWACVHSGNPYSAWASGPSSSKPDITRDLVGALGPSVIGKGFNKKYDIADCPECTVFSVPVYRSRGRRRSSKQTGYRQTCTHSGGPYHTERDELRGQPVLFENICSRKTLDGKEISQEELRAKWYTN